MKIINFESNMNILSNINLQILEISSFKNILINLQKMENSYFIIDNSIIKVNDEKYYCNKIFIDFLEENKEIYLQGAINIKELPGDKYKLNKKEIKKMAKKIKVINSKISKGKNNLKDYNEIYYLTKNYVIAKAMEENYND